MGFGIQRIGRLAPHHACHALVEFQPDSAVDLLLAEVARGLQHLTLRAEPQPVINQFRIARHQFVLQMRGSTIERDLLYPAMGPGVDLAAGCFVHAAALHSDEAVFDQIEPADAVLATQFVECGQQNGGAHRFAVQSDAVALFEIDRDVFGRVGRVFRMVRARIDIVRGFFPGIFQDLAL